MIKTTIYFRILLSLSLILTACSKDSDPDPPAQDPYRAYFNMHHFLTEPYDLQWNINGLAIEPTQSYGVPQLVFTALSEPNEDVSVFVQQAGNDQVIQGDTLSAEQTQYYMLCMLGSEQDPRFVWDRMDMNPPALGKNRMRFVHAFKDLGPVDIYIGGTGPDHRLLSGISFAEISAYIEAPEEAFWASVVVTPHDVAPAVSTLLSFIANDFFQPGQIYLGIIGHRTSSTESAIKLMIYDQPVEN